MRSCSSGAFECDFEQVGTRLLQRLCGLHIGLLFCQLLEVVQGDVIAQEGVCIGQAGELVQWRHGVLWAIDAFDAAGLVGVGFVAGEQAGSMEVQEGVEEVAAEGVEGDGVVLRDMFVAEQLAHDAAVLGFGQAVVVAAPGSATGELDVELSSNLATW